MARKDYHIYGYRPGGSSREHLAGVWRKSEATALAGIYRAHGFRSVRVKETSPTGGRCLPSWLEKNERGEWELMVSRSAMEEIHRCALHDAATRYCALRQAGVVPEAAEADVAEWLGREAGFIPDAAGQKAAEIRELFEPNRADA